MSRSAPSWLATVIGACYTLHFWPPYGDPEVQLAGHYTGWAEEGRLGRRLTDHALGRGARLTEVQREAGGTWVVADVERGVTRDREAQLKERGATRRCSVCKASRDIQAGQITKEEALAKFPDATPAERGILREIFGMEPEAEKAPEPAKDFIQSWPEPVTQYTAEHEALVDALEKTWASPKAQPEQAPELSRTHSLEVPAPRPPEPQVRAEAAPELAAPIEDWYLRAEAEPELELEIG